MSGNPYLEEVEGIALEARGLEGAAAAGLWAARRRELVERYAFSVPTDDVLDDLAALSPLVEIGAGSGYWAWCLHRLGADVLAYDARPPGDALPWDPAGGNGWFDDTWYPVGEGDERAAAAHPERALFLCWPGPESPMAREALRLYAAAGGRCLAFIGARGSCADEGFFAALEGLDLAVRRPRRVWPGIEEEFIVARL